MVNNKISQDEFNVFMGISTEIKVKVMELYLIVGYNMNEVGYEIFGKDDRSFTVSLIHRCYNFAGRNGGKYQEGCKFQKEYNYIISKNDIEEFIKRYPHGTFGNGITFEDFLIEKIKRNRFQSGNNVLKKNNTGRLNRSVSSNTVGRGDYSRKVELDQSNSFDWNQMSQDLFGDNSTNKSPVAYRSNNSEYLNNKRIINNERNIKNNRRKRNPNILVIAIIFFLMFISMIYSGTIFTHGDYAIASFVLTVVTFAFWWIS